MNEESSTPPSGCLPRVVKNLLFTALLACFVLYNLAIYGANQKRKAYSLAIDYLHQQNPRRDLVVSCGWSFWTGSICMGKIYNHLGRRVRTTYLHCDEGCKEVPPPIVRSRS